MHWMTEKNLVHVSLKNLYTTIFLKAPTTSALIQGRGNSKINLGRESYPSHSRFHMRQKQWDSAIAIVR